MNPDPEKQTEEGAAVVLSPERRSQEERKGGRTDDARTDARTDALDDGRSQPSFSFSGGGKREVISQGDHFSVKSKSRDTLL